MDAGKKSNILSLFHGPCVPTGSLKKVQLIYSLVVWPSIYSEHKYRYMSESEELYHIKDASRWIETYLTKIA